VITDITVYHSLNGLSVAIVSHAKLFIRALSIPLIRQLFTKRFLQVGSPAVQQVVGGKSFFNLFIKATQHPSSGIYTGSIVYAATSFFDILPDHYKRKQIALYNPREAPILDHYRLKVPRVRQALETI
jgi:hypothetical protein